MALSSVIRKIGQGAASVGKAVAGPSGFGVIQPAAAPPPQEAPAQAPQEMEGFTLPELDPNDPDYEEKKAVHEAYTRLGGMLKDSADGDGIDYRGKYKELADYAASRPLPRTWNPFSAFAIAMGSEAGAKKVASDNERAVKAAQDREDYIQSTKEAAIKGEIAQALEKGNFRKALQQSEALAELNTTLGRIKSEREHKQQLEEIEAQNKGKIGVANIRAAAARDTAAQRISDLVARYKLSADVRKSMLNLVSHYLGGLQAQKDAAGEPIYTQEQLAPLMTSLVGMAEDHSPIFVSEAETPPGATTPKPGTTVKTGEGPQKNDVVAEAFKRRMGARK